jgi:hypothetical protein
MKLFSSALIIISALLIGVGLLQKNKFNKKFRNIFQQRKNASFDCNQYEKNQFSDSLNNLLKDYIFISEKEGIKPARNLSELKNKIKRNQLIGVESGKGFVLDTFYFSYAVLTPSSREVLDTIGNRFENCLRNTPLKGTKLIVTSMTRTLYTVSRLVKRNRTAVNKSPHLNGNSFDFSFSRFSTKKVISSCEKIYLQETISKILLDLKKEKRCWVTFERYEECLHVVAKKVTLSEFIRQKT